MLLLALALAATAQDSCTPSPEDANQPIPEVEAPAPAKAPAVAPAVVPPPGPATLTTPLMARHAGRLETRASSTWTGWGSERLVDGRPDTSWFSAGGDAAALGKKPWVEVRFPEVITVKHVALLGNREPQWPKGFSIHYGLLELLDANGKVLASVKNEEKNLLADVDFKLKVPVAGVRVVRFTSLMDDGDKTQWKDIALAEVLVE